MFRTSPWWPLFLILFTITQAWTQECETTSLLRSVSSDESICLESSQADLNLSLTLKNSLDKNLLPAPLVLENFQLQQVFINQNNHLGQLEQQKLSPLAEMLKTGNFQIPDEIRRLDQKNIILFSLLRNNEIVVPITFEQIVIDLKGGKINLQEALNKQLISMDQIKKFIRDHWKEWQQDLENKAVQYYGSAYENDITIKKYGKSTGASFASTAPRGPADDPVEINQQNNIKARFDHLIFKGIIKTNTYLPTSDIGLRTQVAGNLKTLGGTLAADKNSQCLGVGTAYTYGWIDLNFFGQWDLTNNGATPELNSITAQTGLSFWNNWLGVSGGLGWNLKSGESLGAGATLFTNHTRQVNYNGPYQGDLKELSNLHSIEVKDQKGVGGYIDFGFFIPRVALGVGALAGYAKTKVHHFKTHLPLVLIQKYLKDRKRWDIGRLFTKPFREGLPKIEEPESMKPLDEVSFSIEREAYSMLSLGLELIPQLMSIVKAGGFKSVMVKYQVKVKKLDQNQLQVTISDMEVKNWSLFLRMLQLIAVSHSHSLDLAKSQTLVFDMNHLEFKKSFAEIILGKIPSFISLTKRNSKLPTEEELEAIYEKDTDLLKSKGITRTQLESISMPLTKNSVSAKIAWFPLTSFPGLAYEKMKGHGSTISSNGEQAMNKDIDIRSKRVAKIYKETTHDLTSVVETPYSHRTHQNNQSRIDLKVLDLYSDSKMDRESGNHIMDKIKKRYGFNLDHYDQNLPAKDVKVLIEKSYKKQDIQTLMTTSNEKIKSIQTLTKIDNLKLTDLRNQLQKLNPDLKLQMSHLQYFIRKHGNKGIKAIDLLTEKDQNEINPWKMTIVSGVYQKPIQKSLDLVATYLDANIPLSINQPPKIWINTKTSKEKIIKFGKRVKKVIAALEEDLKLIEKDPFYPYEKEKTSFDHPKEQTKEFMKDQLSKSKKCLEYLLDFIGQGFSETDSKFLNQIISPQTGESH